MDSGMESQPSPVSMLFLASIFILARLCPLVDPNETVINVKTHRFWNQICTERSVMLICWAIRSLVAAVGVGFLLNSTSRVDN